jgi:hypothetical protein
MILPLRTRDLLYVLYTHILTVVSRATYVIL